MWRVTAQFDLRKAAAHCSTTQLEGLPPNVDDRHTERTTHFCLYSKWIYETSIRWVFESSYATCSMFFCKQTCCLGTYEKIRFLFFLCSSLSLLRFCLCIIHRYPSNILGTLKFDFTTRRAIRKYSPSCDFFSTFFKIK